MSYVTISILLLNSTIKKQDADGNVGHGLGRARRNLTAYFKVLEDPTLKSKRSGKVELASNHPSSRNSGKSQLARKSSDGGAKKKRVIPESCPNQSQATPTRRPPRSTTRSTSPNIFSSTSKSKRSTGLFHEYVTSVEDSRHNNSFKVENQENNPPPESTNVPSKIAVVSRNVELYLVQSRVRKPFSDMDNQKVYEETIKAKGPEPSPFKKQSDTPNSSQSLKYPPSPASCQSSLITHPDPSTTTTSSTPRKKAGSASMSTHDPNKIQYSTATTNEMVTRPTINPRTGEPLEVLDICDDGIADKNVPWIPYADENCSRRWQAQRAEWEERDLAKERGRQRQKSWGIEIDPKHPTSAKGRGKSTSRGAIDFIEKLKGHPSRKSC